MKKQLSYIIFLVDRSGSMISIKKDMVGGFNAFIAEQKKIKGDCKVFFYQFDTNYDTVYEGIDLNYVKDLDDNTYQPRGGTALYPSFGKTIKDIGKKLAAMSEGERPERILFITITDGEHNSSLSKVNGETVDHETFHQFTSKEIKNMVEHQTKIYKWNFIYIGANQDTWAVGNSMGYSKGTTLNYVANSVGVSDMFDKLNKGVTSYRLSSINKKFTFDEKQTND